MIDTIERKSNAWIHHQDEDATICRVALQTVLLRFPG